MEAALYECPHGYASWQHCWRCKKESAMMQPDLFQQQIIDEAKAADDAVRLAIYCVEEGNRRAKQAFDKEIARLDAELKLAQSMCSHIQTRYSSDPSGGNDSCYICNVCGQEL